MKEEKKGELKKKKGPEASPSSPEKNNAMGNFIILEKKKV